MGLYLLSAETTFSAAHTIPGVEHCERLHGHNWRLRVTVRVAPDALDANGMGIDFRLLELWVRDAVSDFEHQYLNDLPPFAGTPPTAERLARIVCDRMGSRLADEAAAAEIVEIEVWEMPQYRVVYRPT